MGKETYLDRADIYCAVNQVGPYLHFWVFCENLARDGDVFCRRISKDGLIMQALRRLSVEHEHARLAARPAHHGSSTFAPSRTQRTTHALRPVHAPARLHDDRHDRVLVVLPALLVQAHDLVDLDVAHEVAGDEDEIGGDDPVRVDVAHSVARSECFFRGDDGHDLDT